MQMTENMPIMMQQYPMYDNGHILCMMNWLMNGC